ncbi:MAG: nitrilase-related carbon-nitrogen hydrolase [Solirubrobacteraceae bacterium]
MTVTRAAAVQLAPVIGELDRNRELAAAAILDAAGRGAQLVVLPELAVSGYRFDDRVEARASAEPLDGPTVARWTELAALRGLTIVGGICELGVWGALHDTVAIVGRDGLIGSYRKTHLWNREREIFDPGLVAPPVLATEHGRLGVAICYDSWFPEVMRRLALERAEVVAVPMNNSAAQPPHTPHQIEVTVAVATAVCNRVFIVQADRSGRERGADWDEASVIVDPDGRLLAGPEPGPAVLVADLELDLARAKAIGSRNDVLADRRPELYGWSG